ncbi:hypothetical protein C1N62_22795 (plasmid) [Nissabacter sp. SGAir0207]|nr:DUF2635 domain-containing protein [Nissabacter sp. SGAir0207]QCR38947.1 hypothetical protein C1N62_22795 [Nissabacter sp. SGAir0207]
MKLKPAAGRAVRDPVKGTLLPEEGAEVVMDMFWRRRLRDGDVVEVTLDAIDTGTPMNDYIIPATVTTDSATTTTENTTTSTEATS